MEQFNSKNQEKVAGDKGTIEQMKAERQFPIAKEGFVFIGMGLVLTLVSYVYWGTPMTLLFGVVTLFCAYFFRDPWRVVPDGEGLLVAPGDGMVVDVSKTYEDRYLKQPAIKISIFLNIFNVHVNRIPVTGRIVGIFYNAGRFFAANVPKASLENEQNALLIETASGKRVVCIQIAGLIARRIVCWAGDGETREHGERFGLIKFGSRVDLFLPADAEVRIAKGDKVKGGETIVGLLK